MHQTLDRCRCRECILEDAFPLRKREVTRQHHTPTLVTLRQKGEKDFHFVTALLHVADEDPIRTVLLGTVSSKYSTATLPSTTANSVQSTIHVTCRSNSMAFRDCGPAGWIALQLSIRTQRKVVADVKR